MLGSLPPPHQRFILFSGKGGVGKTTCAAATAVYTADSGKKTLLFSTDPAHSLADSLEIPLTDKIRQVDGMPNLWAVEINAEKQLAEVKEQYGEEFLDFLVAATYLDKRDVADSLNLDVPGVDELMGLKTVIDLLDKQEFELFVWDTAPTGHTLRLLALPEVFDQWIKLLARLRWKYKSFILAISGRQVEDPRDDLLFQLKKTVKQVSSLLQDTRQSQIVAVALLEKMVIAETKRLVTNLQAMNLPVRNLVLNRVMPPANSCPFCKSIRHEQDLLRDEVAQDFSRWKICQVPLEPGGIRGIELLRKVAGVMYRG